jgi:hypothetical protein
MNRLERLKEQIDSGTYYVDSCALAHKMLDEKHVLRELLVTEPSSAQLDHVTH